ncbi:MAG: hypothetical protein R2851_22345 [Caldilineaceae bacterium]
MTVTIVPERTTAVFAADVLPDGVERAWPSAINGRAGQCDAARGRRRSGGRAAAGRRLDPLALAMTFPSRGAALVLAQSLPPSPDWALMRTLLQQIAPDWADRSGVLRRSMRVSQQYDLGVVARQWQEQADLLEQQAAPV